MLFVQLKEPPSSTHSQVISLNLSLRNIEDSLLNAHDEINAIRKDKHFRFTEKDMMDLTNKLTMIEGLLSELKEKF
jgi:hypothetical protein